MDVKEKVRTAVQAYVAATEGLQAARLSVLDGERAVKVAVRELLRQIHVCCPGKVVSYKGRQYMEKAGGDALEVMDLPDNNLSLD